MPFKMSDTRHFRKTPTRFLPFGSGGKEILVERPQQFLVALLNALVAVAGDLLQSLGIEDGDAAAADLDETGILQGTLHQIDGGALNPEHLPEELLGQADIVAAQPLPALQEPARSPVFDLV